ncbi:hypothetical protein CN97_00885 [Haematobacter massiliensis]|uniref:Uncharacterized protein n=1 Tax=Haematobacter massiliensis TaxID=195105 RepID=A0A086Y0J6_9RHOB|nr:hypothetical protein [Haematobacter massiliensis]KFI27796.1 hypothetical protein CN97_00885 [Haematobacter massiliensis]OWJ82738.1 hypothetical protein CDV51_17165 [Haematobacter massiliensis]
MTLEERVADLEEEAARLRGELSQTKKWMSLMYTDMLKLQFAAAKAIKGDRDAANAIFREVERNAHLLATGNADD